MTTRNLAKPLAGVVLFLLMRRLLSISSILILSFASIACNDLSPRGRVGGNGGAGGQGGTGGQGGAGAGQGGGPPPPTCVMTGPTPQCQTSCPNGQVTTLTGKVYAPNGTLPLYNAIVYVPSQATAPFTTGASCEPCDGKVSGSPIVSALTGPDGSFTLTNVPVGDQIPLVVQMGKWRRQVTLNVPACATTPVDAMNARLPRNSVEGDMPQMAIATGSVDALECLLLKIGIDPAEIQPDSQHKKVAFYTGLHLAGSTMDGANPASSLYLNLNTLLRYDIVFFPCQGTAFDESTDSAGNKLNPDPRPLIASYLNMGGRVFATHYSYDWLAYDGLQGIPTGSSPFNVVGGWNLDQPYPMEPYRGVIDQSFPKGMAFAQWLDNVSPTTNGAFDIVEPKNDLDSVNKTYAQQWITHAGDNKVVHMTFNTPLNPPIGPDMRPQYCGRAVYSDFHVTNQPHGAFPEVCVGYPDHMPEMTTQEKALTFMIFDLSSCVQPDSMPPVPPIT